MVGRPARLDKPGDWERLLITCLENVRMSGEDGSDPELPIEWACSEPNSIPSLILNGTQWGDLPSATGH
jgi:hypothetical protein